MDLSFRALGLAAALISGPAWASTPCAWRGPWVAEDDFALRPGFPQYPGGAVELPSGHLVSLVAASDGKRWHRVVRRKRVGEKWRTVHDTPYDGKVEVELGPLQAVDGHLLFLERQFVLGKSGRSVVLRSDDEGGTWTPVSPDRELPVDGPSPEPTALAPTAAGDPFAIGTRQGGNGPSDERWMVLALRAGSWSVLDDFQVAPGRQARAGALLFTRGVLLAAGWGMNAGYHEEWVVRRSGDGGKSWQTVDHPAPRADDDAAADFMAVDPEGAVWVVGDAGPRGAARLRVRRSLDAGKTWTALEPLDSGPRLSPHAFAVAPDGTLFLTGYQDGEEHRTWWVRTSRDGVHWSDSELRASLTGDSYAEGITFTASGDALVWGWNDVPNAASPMQIRRLRCKSAP